MPKSTNQANQEDPQTDAGTEGSSEQPLEEETPSDDSPEASDNESVTDTEDSDRLDLESQVEALQLEVSQLQEKLDVAREALKSAKQDIGYAQAETQTAIRRGREDTARAINRTKKNLINRLINVADTFHHTSLELQNIERNDQTEVLVSAVEMAINEFSKTLSGEGVEPLNPKGEVFDPNLHEAQVSIPSNEAEPNTVLDVLRIGYQLDGSLLRAPQVVVASAPEKK